MDYVDTYFGTNLKFLREREGKEPEEVAKWLKISVLELEEYESGRKQPSCEMLAELSDQFWVKIDTLIRKDMRKPRYIANLLYIRAFRDRFGTARDGAIALGVSRETYTQIESGKKEITVEQLQKFAKHYEIPLNALINKDFSYLRAQFLRGREME